MRNALLAIITLFLFSFCEKEFSIEEQLNPVPACASYVDWTGYDIPGFQGNCYLVTNAQIRWMQQNGYLTNISLAPDNNTCPTKSQILSYVGSGYPMYFSPEFDALASNAGSPIGWMYQAT